MLQPCSDTPTLRASLLAAIETIERDRLRRAVHVEPYLPWIITHDQALAFVPAAVRGDFR